MSNAPGNKEQSVKIELTPTQESPRDAKPEDFPIGDPVQTQHTPGHNQRGLTKAEEAKLFAETDATRPKQPVPVLNKSVTK
jgi:hypothetical protein